MPLISPTVRLAADDVRRRRRWDTAIGMAALWAGPIVAFVAAVVRPG